ncbi:MAG: recombinase family protein [Clostridiales bacterium]|jgi:site-specific DNA recombinase|nr:recombinase family protein [Clostridiales bacterium]
MKNIAVYARKSKITEACDSINNQIQLCKQYVCLHLAGQEINFIIYQDEGFSGGDTERPMFLKLISDIQNNLLDMLICYRLDRVSRNVADFSSVLKILEGHKVDFVSISENFDTSTPMGRAMIYISSVFAQLERDTIAERISDNLHGLAKSGQKRYLHSTPPEGYNKLRKKGVGGKSYSYLEQDPCGAYKIKFIFDNYLKYHSLSRVSELCKLNGLKTRHGSDFNKSSVKRVLTNPIYAIADHAIYEYFKNLDVIFANGETEFDGQFGLYVFGRFSKKTNSQKDWVLGIGSHKGIIPSENFIKTQNIINKRPANINSKYGLYNGLLICGACGAYFKPTAIKNNKFYYVCKTKEKSRRKLCCQKNICGYEADKMITSKLNFDLSELNGLKDIFEKRGYLKQKIKSITWGPSGFYIDYIYRP